MGKWWWRRIEESVADASKRLEKLEKAVEGLAERPPDATAATRVEAEAELGRLIIECLQHEKWNQVFLHTTLGRLSPQTLNRNFAGLRLLAEVHLDPKIVSRKPSGCNWTPRALAFYQKVQRGEAFPEGDSGPKEVPEAVESPGERKPPRATRYRARGDSGGARLAGSIAHPRLPDHGPKA